MQNVTSSRGFLIGVAILCAMIVTMSYFRGLPPVQKMAIEAALRAAGAVIRGVF
jgi:hypothetical protein